jgi:hypothetical protein
MGMTRRKVLGLLGGAAAAAALPRRARAARSLMTPGDP